MSGEPLSVKGVSFRFGDDEPYLFKDVTFDVKPGEIVAVLGKSGSGKSTLLEVLAGLVEPTCGSVECVGAPVMQPSEHVGFVFQDSNLAVLPWLSVRSNIELGLEGLALSDADRKAKVEGVVSFLQFEPHLLDRYPKDVSGGQRQRTQIGRVLVRNPTFILLDEPASSLDIGFRLLLTQYLARLANEQGKGIALVTHDIDEAVFLANRVYVLQENQDILVEAPGFGRAAASIKQAQCNSSYTQLLVDVHALITPQT